MNTTLRWSARILSVLAVGILLMFAFGEGLNRKRHAKHHYPLKT